MAVCFKKIPSSELSRFPTHKISSPPPNHRGASSSVKNYLVATILAATFAAAFFFLFPPLGVVFTVISGWLFWTSATVLSSHALSDSNHLTAKAAHWIRATTLELNAGIAMAALLPLTFFDHFHQPQGSLEGRPILLVNGYLSFGSTWYYLRRKLVQARLGPVYTMNVGSFSSIEYYAREVGKKIAQIRDATGRSDISLVAHSKGGLVSAYYATRHAKKEGIRITDVITIGCPLAGTPVAKMGLGHDAAQMHPDHPFNVQLRNDMLAHPEIRFAHIASATDLIVSLDSALPAETAGSYRRIFHNLGHLGLVLSPRTAEQVCKWLKRMSIK
ncbi:MAG: hypothetical protein HY861_01085 [Chlamydiia bacterium]|nr:hypothetical protein [Chlamydiia bacterium]